MPLNIYVSALASVTVPQWGACLISVVAIAYGIWLLVHCNHDCPKIFAVFSVAGATMYLVLLAAQLLNAAAIALGQVDSHLSELLQVTSARSLYDLFMASINLMVLRALHDAHK